MSEWSSILTSFIGRGPRTPARQVSYRGNLPAREGGSADEVVGDGRMSLHGAFRNQTPALQTIAGPRSTGREFGDTIVNSKRKFALCPRNSGPKGLRQWPGCEGEPEIVPPCGMHWEGGSVARRSERA